MPRWLFIAIVVLAVIGVGMIIFGLGSDSDMEVESAVLFLAPR
jgi:hypothetical protein